MLEEHIKKICNKFISFCLLCKGIPFSFVSSLICRYQSNYSDYCEGIKLIKALQTKANYSFFCRLKKALYSTNTISNTITRSVILTLFFLIFENIFKEEFEQMSTDFFTSSKVIPCVLWQIFILLC